MSPTPRISSFELTHRKQHVKMFAWKRWSETAIHLEYFTVYALELQRHLLYCVRLTSLSIMFLHANSHRCKSQEFFLFCHYVCACVAVFRILYIPSYIDLCINEHWNWFHILAIMNNAAMNLGVQISSTDLDFSLFGLYTRSWTVGSCDKIVTFFEKCWGSIILFFIAVVPIYVQNNHV